MATATLNSTPKLLRKSNENGSQEQNPAPLEIVPATDADYFEVVARATNDAVRDWDVTTGVLVWQRGLASLLGLAPSDD
jgi:hypothetical protein